MTAFRKLAGIPSAVADLMIRVELGQAKVNAFTAIRSDDPQSTMRNSIVGVLELLGADALLLRDDTFYHAYVIAKSEDAGAPPSETHQILRSQAQLIDFISRLHLNYVERATGFGTFRSGTRDDAIAVLGARGFRPDLLHYVEFPFSFPQLAHTALRSYGHDIGDPLERLSCEKEAVDIAVRWSGEKHPDTVRANSSLAKFLKERAELCEQRLRESDPASCAESDRSELEFWLTQRLPVLNALGWHKEVRGVERRLEILRADLYSTYDWHMKMWRRAIETGCEYGPEVARMKTVIYLSRLADLADRMQMPHVANRARTEKDALLPDLKSDSPLSIDRTLAKPFGTSW
jgi:hypothetical protein